MRTTIVTREAAAVLTLALAGTLASVVTPPVAAGDLDVPQRSGALERAEAEAAQMIEGRLLDLISEQIEPAEARRMVEAEQVQAAAKTRARLLELKSQGLSIREIAESTPGMIVVSAPAEGNSPLSSGSDVSLTSPSIVFTMQCACYTVEGEWEWDISEQETGNDGAGLRMTKTINNMGGSALVCDLVTGCDAFSFATWEDPQGVVHKYSTRAGDFGLVSFSFKKISGGCHQAYMHYAHAWQGDYELVSVNISTGGIGFTFEQPGHKWTRQIAGGTTGC